MDGDGERASTDYGRAWLHYVDRFAFDGDLHKRKLMGDIEAIQRTYRETEELKLAIDNAASAMISLFDSASLIRPSGGAELKVAAVDAIRTFDRILADAEEVPDTTRY